MSKRNFRLTITAPSKDPSPVPVSFSPIAWFRAEDYDGVTWPDYTGNGYDLTATGTFATGGASALRPVKHYGGGVDPKAGAYLDGIETAYVGGGSPEAGYFEWAGPVIPTLNPTPTFDGFTVAFIIKDWGVAAGGYRPGTILGETTVQDTRHVVNNIAGIDTVNVMWTFGGSHFFTYSAPAHQPDNDVEESWVLEIGRGVPHQLRSWLNGAPNLFFSSSSYYGTPDVDLKRVMQSGVGSWNPMESRSLCELIIIPGILTDSELENLHEYLDWRKLHGSLPMPSVGGDSAVPTAATGRTFDVSDRVDIGNLGSVSSFAESDLSVFSHGDMGFTLDNSDGEVEAFFLGAELSDTYEVILRRQRPGRQEWDRIFGGVIDLKASLTYNDKAKTAQIVAYSFSKILERTPADTIKRPLLYKTASMTLDTNVMVFIPGETVDLEVGDTVEIFSLQGKAEQFTVDKVLDSSQVEMVETAGASYSNALVTVTTPFYHDKPPSFLLNEIAEATGLEVDASDLALDVAEFPIATPYTLAGLSLRRRPRSVVPSGTTIIATYGPVDEANRQIASGPTGSWLDGAASNTPQGDWTPYLLSEPGSIMASSNGGTEDTGVMAWDHTNSHVWHIVFANTGFPTFLNRLYLYRDGVDQGFFASIVDGEDFVARSLEYDPVNDRVWVSRRDSLGVRRVRWIPAAGGSYTDFETTVSGYLRMCRALNLLILFDDINYDIRMYDLTTLELVRVIPFPHGIPLPWTARAWEGWFTFVYSEGGLTRIAIYETSSWTLVAGYILSPTPPYGATYVTTQTLADGRTALVAFAGDEWLVLSLRYDGVVRYADFEDKSCGAATRDLAYVTNCLIGVSQFRSLRFANRLALGRGDVVMDLGVPMDRTRRPNSEVYRDSVSVSGENRFGEKIEIIVGDTGKSASRLEIESDLIKTTGMAVSTAVATFQFVGRVRRQAEVTVADDGDKLDVFDRVLMDGSPWVVYRKQTDLEQDTHELTLLELTA